MKKMTKKEFVENFVTIFMASYCSKDYDHNIQCGKYEEIYSPNVEDAFNIAEHVWENMKKINDDNINLYLE